MSVDWSKDVPREIRIKRIGEGEGRTFFIDGEEFPYHVSLDPSYEVTPGHLGEWVTTEDGEMSRDFEWARLTITLPALTIVDETVDQ
jgi:hypothetical protein